MPQDQASSDYQIIRNPCNECKGESEYYHPPYNKMYCWKHFPEEGWKNINKESGLGPSINLDQCYSALCNKKINPYNIYCNIHRKEYIISSRWKLWAKTRYHQIIWINWNNYHQKKHSNVSWSLRLYPGSKIVNIMILKFPVAMSGVRPVVVLVRIMLKEINK